MTATVARGASRSGGHDEEGCPRWRYAQAVTFGLLLARAQGISFTNGIDAAAKKLSGSNSLIGTALRVLTDSVVRDAVLPTSVATLGRVLAVWLPSGG